MSTTTTTDIAIPLTIQGLTWRKITDQIVAGLEGGIGYWASSFKPDESNGPIKADVSPWYDDEKFWARGDWKIIVETNEDGVEHITPEKMRAGIQYLADNHLWRINQAIKENGDSETGDVFIQAFVFGDIVYG